MPRRPATAQEDKRFRVLRLLESHPDLTQREIADRLGISLGGVNYCVRALTEKGLVKIKNFRNSSNKLGYAYLLTPTGVAEKTALAARFLKRKLMEYEALRAEIDALEQEVRLAQRDGASNGHP
ncbi:MAG: MarR family EPS-associated transcriptional regulator [Sedimenticola sp.]|nr:MarR family EPS-associated transcriptional regulator [Sedimenticola sp.]